MQELVGQTFSLADGRYKVVDVRQLSGEAMVYAEEIGRDTKKSSNRRPRRAAFHYGDIAELLQADKTA
ncbi:MAG: hypothetical protein O6766_11630 [Gammaproteobacteria bacterium]|nr:hypothetical protein [Gammaproteobacteria bacterium]